MIKKLKKELSTAKHYILVSILIIILTLLPQILFSPAVKHTVFIFLLAGLMLLLAKINKIIFAIFAVYINMTNIIIGHISMHWGYDRPSILARITAASLSPKYETIEYLKNYINYKDFLLLAYTVFVLFIIMKFIKQNKNSLKAIKVYALVFLILIIFLFNRHFNKEPITVITECVSVYENGEVKTVSERNKFLASLKQKSVQNDRSLYDKIIIVVGESANKHHMGIYNYDINTTPFFSSLSSDKNFYKFNAIAPANQTRLSVPLLLTTTQINNFTNSYIHSVSLLTDFNAHGFQTKWISNQGKIGGTESLLTSIINEAKQQTFFNNRVYTYSKTDREVIKYLNKQNLNAEKELIVIHLMGSHFDYKDRYTKEHAIFKNTDNLVKEYDNSIYFTDFILKNIVEHYNKGEKLLLVYFSDHGEIVDKEKFGHGFNPAFKDEYEVPFVIYSSIPNPKIDELRKRNTEHYFNMENTFYVVEYIVGIRPHLNLSFSSKVLDLDKNNIINYENLLFYKKK